MSKVHESRKLYYPNQFNFIVKNASIIIYHIIIMHLTFLNWSKCKWLPPTLTLAHCVDEKNNFRSKNNKMEVCSSADWMDLGSVLLGMI